MARKAVKFSVLAALTSEIIGLLACSLFPTTAHAALYDPSSWYVTAGLSYDVIDPQALNNLASGNAPLQGFIGGRLLIERGLIAPDWSHWVEVGYLMASTDGNDVSLTGYNKSLTHLYVLPIGINWWFTRSSYIDIGLGVGGGLGILSTFTLAVTPLNGSTTTTTYTGKIAPIVDAKAHGRLWLGKYFGLALAGGFRYYAPAFEGNGTEIQASLVSLEMMVGATFAFGGVKGTGRTYAEVLPPDKTSAPKKKRRGKPAPPARSAPGQNPRAPKPPAGR